MRLNDLAKIFQYDAPKNVTFELTTLYYKNLVEKLKPKIKLS